MKVSVIVPVYNVRDYLADCVASIRAQTFADFECILVDDGSTDGSGTLCDELAAADSRFRVVHKPNGGLSDARNAGLDAATGEAVFFVDSDDQIFPQALEALLEKMRCDNLDVAVGKVVFRDMRTGEERPYAPLSTPHPHGILDELFNVSACNKLYRREVFATRRYQKGIKFEDMPVWADILFSGARIGYVDETVYVYNVNRGGSITVTGDYRGYPPSWTTLREALKAHGRYDRRTASDLVCRVALKLVQNYALSGPAMRKEFYQLTQDFFRGCGKVGIARDRNIAVALAAYVHYRCCLRLPYGLYRLLFGWETVLAVPRLNAFFKRALQQ